MKRIYNITKIAVLFALFGYCGVANAQGTSGNWEATEISSTKTIDLTGNVTIEGTITIPSGFTLTINAGEHQLTPYTSTAYSSEATDYVEPISFQVMGKLVINGGVVDGGNTTKVGNSVGGGGEGAANAINGNKAGIFIKIVGKGEVSLNDFAAKNLYSSPKGSACFIQTAADSRENTPNATSVSGRAKVILNNVSVDNCLNNNDHGIIYAGGAKLNSTIEMTKCTITNCMVKANGTGTGYGGVIKGAGQSDCNLIMKECTMTYCWGSGWGGAILWAANGNNCKAILNNCTFENNYARYLGGAISTESTLELEDCNILNNTAGYGGGGIAAFPFTLSDATEANTNLAVGLQLTGGNRISGNRTLYKTNKGQSSPINESIEHEVDYGFNPRYTIKDASDVYYPSGGGGIWILMNKDGWNCEVTISKSNVIESNYSAYDGGGVYFYKQRPHTGSGANVKFVGTYTGDSGLATLHSYADFKGNESARSGGGIAVGADNATIKYPTVDIEGGEIINNIALNGNGGGVYMPGGIFTMNAGNIKNNDAKTASSSLSVDAGNGGGIAIMNGTFTVTGDSEISSNKSAYLGGGLFVYNEDNTGEPKSISFEGGVLKGNSASNGGGVCASGNLALKISGVTIERNTSTNGGGIYLTQGASMDFGSGKIRNNQALYSDNYTEGTAYGIDADKVKGVGGGIYLDSNTTLTFSVTTELGLYGNQAAIGADDIFANGNNTSVALPNVSDMVLEGFKAPNSLYWVEDYIVNDKEYANHGTGEWGGDTRRYRELLASQDAVEYPIVEVTGSSLELKKYVSLALGYEIIYITIQKQGLKTGESAMFILTQRGTDNKTWLPEYMRVLLTGSTTGGVVSRKVGVPSGYWKVEETNWSWAYTFEPENGIEREIIDTKEDYIFEFKNTPKTNTPERDEDVKVNEFNKPVTTTTKKL